MIEYTNLEKDLTNWLENIAIINKVDYRNSKQAIIGFPSQSFMSDGMLLVDNNLIAIEVEAGQTHPDTNTGKYWYLYDKFRKYYEMLLFHIFTPQFNSYNWRKKLGEFYVKKMIDDNVPMDYILLDYRTYTEYSDVLEKCKIQISKRINKMVVI